MIYVSIFYLSLLTCQQFPALAPPASSRRNTAVARMMQNRPLPPPPKSATQQMNQSSMVDLMDIFTTPAPSTSNSSGSQQQQESPPKIAKAATSVNNSEVSNSSFGKTMTVENQQVQDTSTLLQIAANAGTIPPPNLNEKATPIAVAFVENISARLKGSDQLQ